MARLEPRLLEVGARLEHVGALEREERRARAHPLAGLDQHLGDAACEGGGDRRQRLGTESGAAEIGARAFGGRRAHLLDLQELARDLGELHLARACADPTRR